jgi:diketogulonate reductase-like aldo/keto reductase
MATSPSNDPVYAMSNGKHVPALAFGLYKIPSTEEGEMTICDAIKNGYRHFDTASLYENERILGNAIRKSGIPRKDFFVASKVWNDAQKAGRTAVRASIEKSLRELDLEWIDAIYIHWPVPGCVIETYKEMQLLYQEGKIRSIALSNFGIAEYEELVNFGSTITVPPSINQIEVSPFMYRPETIDYFQERNILVAASKSLHRASGIEEGIVKSIADKHGVTSAQVMVRWSFQKRLIVVVKTSQSHRMKENRDVLNFSLTEEELNALDSLTSEKDISDREEIEIQRRNGI